MSETDSKEQSTDNTLNDMIPFIIGIGLIIIFCLVVAIICLCGKNELLDILQPSASKLTDNLENVTNILNAIIEKNINSKIIFSLITLAIF